MKPWIQKYLPKTSKEVLGQQKAVSEVLDFVAGYKQSKTKAALLYGGVGSGKTSAVHAVANELGLELIELNASDIRNKGNIEEFLGNALGQQSLFFKGKIILVDEVDGLSGTKDRGGLAALSKLMEKSSFPIICTVEDPFNQKLNSFRKKAQLIQFNTLDYRTITNNLKRILDSEGAAYDEEAVKALARRAGNDMRAAINDLQTISGSGSRKVTLDTVKELDDNERNKKESMTNALMRVFKTTDVSVAKGAFDSVDEDIDKIALWLEENIPKEYEGEDLRNAMMWMSRADVFKGRIRRWQHWRFIVYIFSFYSIGIALSKKEKYKKFVKYTPTTRLLKIWQANMKYQKRKVIAEKIAAKTHTSSKRVIQDVIPYIRVMVKQNENYASSFMDEFDLEKEEIAWLKK